MFCQACGAAIPDDAVVCIGCGRAVVPMYPATPWQAPAQAGASTGQADQSLIVAGYVCAGVALILLPPILALAGLIIGIVNVNKNQVQHGVAQIILSIVSGIIGTILSYAVFRNLLR
jgi:hypothetical protein